MKEEFPGNLTRKGDIYNYRKTRRQRAAGEVGETPMQVKYIKHTSVLIIYIFLN
jgi:hypothetical protein